MARIIYGALAESIRGSIGGTTFQKNAYGYTIKKKPNMIKPNSSFQQTNKSLFARAVKAWNVLTNAQRADWVSWASTFPQYAKHNPSSMLSGYAVFVRRHFYKFLAGNPVDVSPTYSVLPSVSVTISMAVGGGVLNLSWVDDNAAEDFKLSIFISRVFSASQNFIGTKTRYFDTVSSDGGSTVDRADEWIAVFGTLPTAGQLVAYRVIACGDNNGVVQAEQTGIIEITAIV